MLSHSAVRQPARPITRQPCQLTRRFWGLPRLISAAAGEVALAIGVLYDTGMAWRCRARSWPPGHARGNRVISKVEFLFGGGNTSFFLLQV